MVVNNVRYICDHCKKEVSKQEYEYGAKVTMRVDLNNPKGSCGQVAASHMQICINCANELGVGNREEYHRYTYSQSLLRDAVDKVKDKLFKLFHKEEEIFKRYEGKYARVIDVNNLYKEDEYQKTLMEIEFDDGKKYKVNIEEQ